MTNMKKDFIQGRFFPIYRAAIKKWEIQEPQVLGGMEIGNRKKRLSFYASFPDVWGKAPSVPRYFVSYHE